MRLLAALLGCTGAADKADDTSPDRTGTDTATDTTDTDTLEADDARVRALTGLAEGDSPCAEPMLVRIENTVDGDTFWCHPDAGGEAFKVRVIGVDTPEIAHEDPAECYGDEAWDYSAAALDGRLAWLTFDTECEDVYGRSLAYVFRGDDEAGFFNRALARNGYATVLTIPPDDTYADLFTADARAARDEGLGLWGACDR